jgi:hypothetical protein
MKWEKTEKEFDRFELDETFIKNNILSKERVRIVKYTSDISPVVYYTKSYKVYDRYESNFNFKYPLLAKIAKLCRLQSFSSSLSMNKETFEAKYNIKL